MASRILVGIHDLFYSTADVPSADTYLGHTGPEGITLNLEHNFSDITGDALGPETVVDSVYHGGNCTVEFVLQEVQDDANGFSVRQYLSPFRESTYSDGLYHNEVGQPGKLISQVAGDLTAIPRAGTPTAASSHNMGRVFKGVHVGPTVERLDNLPNFIPSRFRALPYNESGVLVWWAWYNQDSDPQGHLNNLPATDSMF